MEINQISTSIQSMQTLIPQTTPEPPDDELQVVEQQDNGKANGAVRKLNEGGHYNPVAEVRLRINHFDNPDLEKIDPDSLPDPQDVPGKAYEKFLDQYRALYNAGLPAQETEDFPEEPPTIPEEPGVEIPQQDPEPAIIEEPVIEPVIVPQEPVIEIPAQEPEDPPEEPPTIPDEPVVEILQQDPEPAIIEEPVIEPVIVPQEPVVEVSATEAEVPEDEGSLAAFEEFWNTPDEQEPQTLNIII